MDYYEKTPMMLFDSQLAVVELVELVGSLWMWVVSGGWILSPEPVVELPEVVQVVILVSG